ncbi:hypothetical protein BLOT_006311 [Blomia tropicalis]|nr:hypothetical protein BLOT_006311 [Blomia tropicalis]
MGMNSTNRRFHSLIIIIIFIVSCTSVDQPLLRLDSYCDFPALVAFIVKFKLNYLIDDLLIFSGGIAFLNNRYKKLKGNHNNVKCTCPTIETPSFHLNTFRNMDFIYNY